MEIEEKKPTIFLVDQLRLRRACLRALLEPWATTKGAQIATLSPNGLPNELESAPRSGLAIYALGSSSICDPDVQINIGELLSLLDGSPLVLMSDLNDASEAIETFRLGATAFVTNDMEPDLVCHVLDFIIQGGTYFPPHILAEVPASNKPRRLAEADQRLYSPSGNGGEDLSAPQRQVASLLLEGLPNKTIASRLNISEANVKAHVRQIMKKYRATNRTQAALYAMRAETAPGVNDQEDAATVSAERTLGTHSSGSVSESEKTH